MRLAIMTQSFAREMAEGRMSFVDFVRFCAAQHVEGVEFTNADVDGMADETVRACLADAGVEPAAYIIRTDFVCEDADCVKEAVELVQRELERAKRLGASLAMLSTGAPKPDISFARGRELIATGLATCAGYGKRIGVTVTTENHGGQARFRGLTEHMLGFLAQAQDLAVTFDDGNFLLAGEDPLEAFRQLAHRIVHVHLKDFKVAKSTMSGGFPVEGRAGYAYYGVPVGEGEVPTRAILQALGAMGYQGYVSIEHGGNVAGWIGVPRAVRYVRRALRADPGRGAEWNDRRDVREVHDRRE